MAETGNDTVSGDIATGKLLITGATVVAVLALVLAGMYGLYLWFGASVNVPLPGTIRPTRAISLTPHLQDHPGQDLQALRRRKQAVLDSYGWVDRDAGIARIPIARAMALLVERRQQRQGDTPP